MSEFDEFKEIFRTIPYFEDYSETELNECANITKKIDIDKNEIVFGDGIGMKNYAHIILSGECRLIQLLTVVSERYSSKKIKYNLYNSKDEEIHKKIQFLNTKSNNIYSAANNVEKDLFKIEQHFIQISLMKSGTVFNIGEEMPNRFIVALTKVTYLIIPLYWLFTHDKRFVWTSLRRFLNQHLPNTKKVFENFVNDKKWAQHRLELIETSLQGRRSSTGNSIHNVPKCFRVKNMLSLE